MRSSATMLAKRVRPNFQMICRRPLALALLLLVLLAAACLAPDEDPPPDFAAPDFAAALVINLG